MKLLKQRWLQGLVGALVLSAASAWLVISWLHNPMRGLPHDYAFQSGSLDNWQSFGGTWNISHGVIQNNSDERGAKILTGSPYWKNYSIEADMELLGSEGDAGLIVRSSNEQTGVDAYKGYYAGLRGRENELSTDDSLIIGKADYEYISIKHVRIASGVAPFRWYHLKLLIYGCHIVAAVTWPLHSGRTYTVSAVDPHCYKHGRVGLRSYASGGVWKNIKVQPATRADMDKMLAVPPPTPLPPGKRPASPSQTPSEPPAPNLRTIARLRLMPADSSRITTTRGVVIATSPQLYIEDSTGGAAVEETKAIPLKIGDEVQASGLVDPGVFSPVLRHATVHVLWASTPIPPVFATSSQAATGAFDSTFIEVRGYLVSRSYKPHHPLVLHLREGQQTFQALLYGEQAASLYDNLRPGSLITVSGVCVVGSRYTHNLTPFALLLRSSGDLSVLHGPPWWTPRHLIELTIVVFLLLLFIQYLHSRMEHWRLRAVLDERGRIAHEMHDTLAQSFAGIGFQLEALRNQIPSNSEAGKHLNVARDLVRYSHEEARRNIASLRPEFLASLGLVDALKRFLDSRLTAGEVRIITEGNEASLSLPPGLADTLFRIGQEAIANTIRHAHPSTIAIRLHIVDTTVEFSIQDDGIGFDQSATTTGFGLEGMRRRAEMISARININSSPEKGTTITVQASLPSRLTWKTIHLYTWTYIKELLLHRVDHAAKDSRPYSG